VKSCQKCLSKQDWICLRCGGCGDCCRCVALQRNWVHIASLEGSIKRNEVLREALAVPKDT